MLTRLAPFTPIVLFMIPLAIMFCLFTYWNWATKTSRKKNPINRDLLRAPGETLRTQIEEMSLDIFSNMALVLIIPLLGYAILVSDFAFGKKPNLTTIISIVIVVFVTIIYFVVRIYKQLKLRRQYVLGCDAEMAVGQELNYLMQHGYTVFHDFPAENFNIDHVVIGPNGVFAVETKGRPKRMNKSGSLESEVTCDGNVLHFPFWKERKPLSQAADQAKWLQNWLSSAVGKNTNVYPVLALPGWFVKRTKNTGTPVINGKNPTAFFMSYGKDELSEIDIKQLVHNVEQRCRTVLPKAYSSASR
jgi:hypothetical protein